MILINVCLIGSLLLLENIHCANVYETVDGSGVMQPLQQQQPTHLPPPPQTTQLQQPQAPETFLQPTQMVQQPKMLQASPQNQTLQTPPALDQTKLTQTPLTQSPLIPNTLQNEPAPQQSQQSQQHHHRSRHKVNFGKSLTKGLKDVVSVAKVIPIPAAQMLAAGLDTAIVAGTDIAAGKSIDQIAKDSVQTASHDALDSVAAGATGIPQVGDIKQQMQQQALNTVLTQATNQLSNNPTVAPNPTQPSFVPNSMQPAIA